MRNSIKRAGEIIGKPFADNLSEVILKVGEDEFTKQECIDVLGCGNFIAASKVTKLIKRYYTLANIAQLAKIPPVDLLRIKGLGAASMWVIMCALDSKGFSVEKWWGWHDNELKFSSYRYNVMKRAKKRVA